MEETSIGIKILLMVMTKGIPAIFIAVGGILVYKAIQFFPGARETTGTVVGVKEIRSAGDGETDGHEYSYQITFEYALDGGEPIQAKLFSQPNWAPQIGDEHMILVNPEKSDTVRLPGIWHYVIGPGIMLIGLAALVALWGAID